MILLTKFLFKFIFNLNKRSFKYCQKAWSIFYNQKIPSNITSFVVVNIKHIVQYVMKYIFTTTILNAFGCNILKS